MISPLADSVEMTSTINRHFDLPEAERFLLEDSVEMTGDFFRALAE